MRRTLPRWTIARRTTAAGFAALLVLGGLHGLSWFRGSLSAASWFGVVPIVDPLAALESSLASRGVVPEVLVGAGFLVVAALVLGPVFCGWVCPLGLALDLNQSLRRRLLGPRRSANGPRVIRELRWGLLGLVVGLAFAARLPLFQTLSPINLLGWSLVFGAMPALAAVGALAAVEWAAPRLWCRSLCPLGALYGLLGRLAPFRIRIHPDVGRRRPCHLCTISCPMGIRVVEEYTHAGRPSVDDPDCIRCGACVEVCPRGTLKLGFRGFAQGTGTEDRIQPDSCILCGMQADGRSRS